MRQGKNPKLLASLMPVLCLHAGACLVAFAAVNASGGGNFTGPKSVVPTHKFEGQHIERRSRTAGMPARASYRQASEQTALLLPSSFNLDSRPVAVLSDSADIY